MSWAGCGSTAKAGCGTQHACDRAVACSDFTLGRPRTSYCDLHHRLGVVRFHLSTCEETACKQRSGEVKKQGTPQCCLRQKARTSRRLVHFEVIKLLLMVSRVFKRGLNMPILLSDRAVNPVGRFRVLGTIDSAGQYERIEM